jgi:ABC-type glycerol-3-phosphate transport system substrate-binding protein
MKGFKKTVLLQLLILLCLVVVTACSGTNDATEEETSQAETENAATESTETNQEKSKIVFYGKIVEYSSGEPMVTALQEELKDKYDIEGVQVDWANLEKVIKTGIASGAPADVYQYWPMYMNTFVDAQQALDLTPYLEANGGEWKKTFNPGLLELGNFNGKYYNVPLNSNFSVIYANADLFEQAGVEIPSKWSWEQFMNVSKTIEEKTDAFPFAIASEPTVQTWLARNGILSIGKSENKIDALANGEIPTTDPLFATVLTNIKALYDSKYWYPGEGALTVSRDEVKAAFYQGKVAMLAEVSANAKSIVEGAPFQVVPIMWPAMGAETAFLGGADGLFIPANAKDKDASVEVLKVYLGEKIQTIHADAGFAIANVNVKVSDPVISSLSEMNNYIISKEFFNISPKMKDYADKQLIAEFILGKSLDEVLGELEKIRLEAINQ